jgi:hypothetical protein
MMPKFCVRIWNLCVMNLKSFFLVCSKTLLITGFFVLSYIMAMYSLYQCMHSKFLLQALFCYVWYATQQDMQQVAELRPGTELYMDATQIS